MKWAWWAVGGIAWALQAAPPISLLPGGIDVERMTLVGGLAWALLALGRGWVVPGPTHKALREDRDDWRTRCDRLTAIAELALRARVEGSSAAALNGGPR
jgi:hypothetical protein